MSVHSFFRGFPGDDLLNKEVISFLDQNIAEKLSNILNESEFPIKSPDKKEFSHLLSGSFDKDIVDKITDLISQIYFMLRISDDYNEFKTIEEDTLSSLPDKEKTTLSTFINSLKHIEIYYENRRLERYKNRAINYYRDMSYSCSLTGRFKKDYDYKKIQIENYKPEIIDTFAMVSLHFVAGDRQKDNDFMFSVNEDELDKIISILLAAQKELKILKNKANF